MLVPLSIPMLLYYAALLAYCTMFVLSSNISLPPGVGCCPEADDQPLRLQCEARGQETEHSARRTAALSSCSSDTVLSGRLLDETA